MMSYSHEFKALMTEYRQRWGFEFPIYNVQLSDYTSKGISFCPNSGYIRAQQFNAYLDMTGVRLIPSYDLGSDEGSFLKSAGELAEPHLLTGLIFRPERLLLPAPVVARTVRKRRLLRRWNP